MTEPIQNKGEKGTRKGQFPKGHTGRPKGTLNKATMSVKQALLDAFDNLGGVPALTAWATEDPTEFYRLWSKILPMDVKHDVGEGLKQFIAVWGNGRPPHTD